MENQHRKITGYRELNQDEIDLMNEIKALGPAIEAVIIKVRAHIEAQEDAAYGRVFDPEMGRKVAYGGGIEEIAERHLHATPGRFASLSATEFQTALMHLTRAVAQPTF